MFKKLLLSILLISVGLGQSVVSFDGSNDYLSTEDTTGTALYSDFTVSGWVFPKSDGTQQVMKNGTFEIQYQGSYYRYFSIYPGGYRTTFGKASINEWHHIVVTRSGANLNIYINGELHTTSTSFSSGNFTGGTNIGRDQDYGEYFRGFMDEFAIWNTALDSNAVKSLYNGGTPKSASAVNSSNLRSYWAMDDGSGASATNAISNSPGLVLNGASWSTFTISPKPERIADINSGSTGSYPRNFNEYNGKVYFTANDGTYGEEIWVYDPSDSTTARVTDIASGSNSGLTYNSILVEYNGKLYFEGYESTYGAELYSYDGTNVTRISDIYTGSNSSYAKMLTVFNDTLFFVSTNNTYGYEWYSYDGTNIVRRTDIRTGGSDGVYPWIQHAKVYKDKIYFAGYDNTKGIEFFSYDATNGAQIVSDLYSGSGSSYPSYFMIFDNKLYFKGGYNTNASSKSVPDVGSDAAGSSGSSMSHNDDVLKFDGTTVSVVDMGNDAKYINLFGESAIYKNKMYLSAFTEANGYELWSYDETNGAQMVADSINSGSNSSYPYFGQVFNDKLYFRATDGTESWGGSNYELWYYDGTGFGRAGDIYQSINASYPQNLYASNDALYFSATDGSKGYEPYAIRLSDPKPTIASVTSTTSNGTYKVGDEINITLNFSEAVTLSTGGTLTVTLETGDTDQTVIITSISNATTGSGTFTVMPGDLSSGLNVSSVSVTGSITDASSQVMDNFTVGSNLSASSILVIDGVLPTITSVKSTNDNATYSVGANINITVNFSEAVSLSDSSSMTVTLETGTIDREVSITSISNSNTTSGTYTVQSGDTSSDLDVSSIALSSGATLSDGAGNVMSVFTVPSDSSLADFNNIVLNTTKPGTPTNIAAENRYGGIGLKWNTESSAAKYYVYRSSDNSTFSKLSTEPTDTVYTESLTAGDRYYYYVTAVNSANTEGDSSRHVSGYATEIWWVDDVNGSDSNSGKAESEAFKTIEQALKTNSDLASGDTIYVNPSITNTNSTKHTGYYDFGNISSGLNLNHNKDFVLKSTAGADSTIFNAEGKNRHFYFDDGQTENTKIIGFTFFNGKEDDNWPGGGALVIDGSSTKIAFENCVFDSNRVVDNYDGGAIVIRNQATPSFTACTFKNNYVIGDDNSRYGGAVRIESANSEEDLKNTINFTQTKFISNYARSKRNAYGGAVYANRNTLFENCLFVKNGAISGYGSTNTNDWTEAKGGAIVSNGGYDNTGVVTVISSSTFDRNYLDVQTVNGNPRGAVIYINSWGNTQTSKAFIYNSIITGSYRLKNNVNYTEYESDKIFTTDGNQNRFTADYSAIEGSTDQGWADDNVYDINPVFSDTANMDYALSIKSPLLGKGGKSSWEGIDPPTIDILGNTRPSPTGSNPDMGAYENALSSSASPLPVANLTGTSKTNSVYLSWTAVKASVGSSTDASNIRYQIYQGDSQVGTSVSTSFTVPALTNGTAYTFNISAQDTSSGEIGANSEAITVTPKFLGPKWYVAASNGSSLADTSSNADLGGFDDPINHLTSAMEIAASGDTIVMMSGTHSGSNNRGISFKNDKSLVIMGDPNYTADKIIIDAGARDRHFSFHNGEDSTYQIIGLTLYNGKTTDYNGGGSISIRNYSSPIFKRVIFKENVNLSDRWEGGGAVNVSYYSTPSFYYCTFDGNVNDRTNTENDNETNGGAVFIAYSSNSANSRVLFDGCIFKNNMAKSDRGAQGGALFIRESQADVLNSLFYGNTAYSSVDGTQNASSRGGAINVQTPAYYSNSDNSWKGGGVNIINCTIVNNSVKNGGSNTYNAIYSGVHLDSWSKNEKVWFFNNIVWGNKNGSGEYKEQVFLSNEDGWGQINFNYNVVQNSSDISKLQDDNSFETDPTFSDSTNGDYSLSNASQLIGAGGAKYEGVNAPTADILGLSRPNPSGSNPDIGAYENSLSTTPYPSPVKNLTAVGGSQSVTLTWDAVAGADSVYKVYQHTSAFSVDAAYYVDTTSTTSYTITGLNNATRYYFRVSAVNKKGYEGTASASVDITPEYSGPIWWVSVAGNNNNEGSSGSPFATISHAMGQVSAGDTIMLKPGTYTGSGNREIEISHFKSDDFSKYKNLVITSEKGADSTIINANDQGRHFTIKGNSNNTIDSTLQFIGLTFTGGLSNEDGGSFYIEANTLWNNSLQTNVASQMQPKFKDCVFKNNEAFKNTDGAAGGAVRINSAAAIFENCVFEGNYSNSRGGAISFSGDNQARIDTTWFRNSTFKNNVVNDLGQTQNEPKNSYGGAISLDFGMSLIILNSTFSNNGVVKNNNSSHARGGALSIDEDWSLRVAPLVWVYNSRFTKNNVTHNVNNGGGRALGGAISAGAPIVIANTVIDSNSVNGINCNNGCPGGGGVYIRVQSQWDNNGNGTNGPNYLINNTIVNNYGSASSNNTVESGGIFVDHVDEQRGAWFNNIIWGNRTNNDSGDRHNLNYMNNEQFKIAADYNNVEGIEEYSFIMGENSYDLDPVFYSPTNYQLSIGSPLIGAGTASYDGANAPKKDILGNDRPNPTGSNPDLGAYENSLAESPYPKQVQKLIAQAGSKEVSLSWEANTETDIAKYLVYKSEIKGFAPTSADSVGETTSTSFTITGLNNRVEYYFSVAAVDKEGYRGIFANEVSAIPKYMGPDWYVAVNGSNDNDGDKNSPLSDLRTAIDSAQAGHTVILLAGQHSGPENRNIQLNTGRQIRIIGDPNANVSDVILDAEFNGSHFNIMGDYDSTLFFQNITFIRGSGQSNPSVTNMRRGGSIEMVGGSFWDEKTQQQIEGFPSPKFVNCVWEDNHAGGFNDEGLGGAIMITDASPIFVGCKFTNNGAGYAGGAFYAQTYSPEHASSPEFRGTLFSNNYVETQDGFAQGGAVTLSGPGAPKFIECFFQSNRARSQNNDSFGGAVATNYWQTDYGTNVRFSQCVFVNNVAESDVGGAHGGAIHSSTPFELENSIVIKNKIHGNYGSGGGLAIQINEDNGSQGHSLLINNTIVDNEVTDNAGNPEYSGGGISVMHSNQGGLWFNNIVFGNNSRHDKSINLGGNANIDMGYLNVDDAEDKSWFNNQNMITAKPKFRNPTSGDYRLSFTSALIDAGTDSYGGRNAPRVDYRNYYRIGVPDMGALEAGASKYIMALEDDITEDKDTTFVNLNQEVKFTITTGDIDGKIVTDSNEPVKWDIFPNQKYARISETADSTTSGGTATATVTVTSQTKGKGFRFRVIAEVGEAYIRSEMYVIEEMVTGAPPPVKELTITPSDWTNQPDFTLNWNTPIWAAERELIGAVVEITDGLNKYNEYLSFPSGDTLSNYSFSTPEAGQYTTYLWLVDELGNEDPDSAMSVTAYFDNIPPEEFNIHWPWKDVWVSDKPQFRWESAGDYPSGTKVFHIFVDENHYAAIAPDQVNYDQNSKEFYIDAPKSIPDGYHSWHMETWDMAENITWSNDTINFGIDINAPIINHNSPLTVVDEGSTTPAITVNVFDGGSGVMETFLYYRRSGSGSGFVSVDMSSGSYSIPGGDVKSDGLEYFIRSADNVGNNRYWPAEGEFHSVKVRTEQSISTTARWPSGVPGGKDSTNYVFFSIPFDVGNARSAILSVLDPNNEGPDEFKYRLYSYNNGWQENPSSITMGNGYFLIYDPDKYSDNPQITFDFGQGISTPTEPPYGFGVTQGQWKFFGSPYNFNVSLDNIYTDDGINIRDAGSIYTWNNSWSSAGSSLQPWKGYIFKSGGSANLNIDVRGTIFGKMAKAMNPDDYPMDANEWIVDMIATTANARDELNSVGVRSFASDGYDPLDEFEPPGVPGDVVLRIDNRNRQETPDLYAKDIRKPNEEGHFWDIQIFAPTNGQRTYITFEGLGYVPEEYDVFLINKTTKQAKNLEWDSQYRFANTGSESYLKQEFRLVVGTKKFVEENNAGVELYPDAFTLSQNYPNPFNPQTSIMISLEEDANVDLVIYNLLGEEITRLAANEYRPAGYYNFIWNGRNAIGDKVATGVYFYHAMIRNDQGKVVLNKTKKMIFLK